MKKAVVMIMIISSLFLIGCSTHVHTVGTGPQSGQVETARQYYLLYGLIPLNSVDTGAMAGSAANYEIQTQVGGMDVVINIASAVAIAGIVSSRTVTVTK
jgi:PBP1b-binding outer membrane lipoprotein LpoB